MALPPLTAGPCPFGDRVGDRRMAAWPHRDRMHIGGEVRTYQPGAAAIGPAAQIGGKSVVIGDLDAIRRNQSGAEREAAAHHVDGDPVGRGLRPDGEVAAHNLRRRHLDAVHEHGDARLVRQRTVKVGDPGEEPRGPHRLRHMQFGREPRVIALAPCAAEQWRGISERAEEVAKVPGAAEAGALPSGRAHRH